MSNKNKTCYTSIGGQAVMEGILMRGPKKTSLSVRMPDKSICTEYMKTNYLKDKYKIFKAPILRGIASLIDSLILGYKALSISTDKAFEDEEIQNEIKKKNKKEKGKISKFITDKMTAIIMVISSILGIALAIGIFLILPTWLYNLGQGFFGDSTVTRSVIEGIMRIIIFLVYIVICSQLNYIKRVFQYHGAEHKTIFCYEAQKPLTVENVKKYKRFHPRCGTSFLVILLILGIVVGFFIPFSNPFLRSAVKILCIPLIIGLGYELIRVCGKYDNTFTKIVSAPGLWVQRITTKEPDDKMIEVAIDALNAVIPENENKSDEDINNDITEVIQTSKTND